MSIPALSQKQLDQISAYRNGYAWALSDKAAANTWAAESHDTGGSEDSAYWRDLGIRDGLSGAADRFASVLPQQNAAQQSQTTPQQAQAATTTLTGVRKAPVYQSKGGTQTQVAAPGQALERGAPVKVSYQNQGQIKPMFRAGQPVFGVRYLELACYRNRKLIPYDEAVQIQRNPLSAQLGGLAGAIVQMLRFDEVSFDLLGDDPGEQREGYRLSGPTGPLARMIQREVAAGVINPNPRAYGMNDWVGARLSSGRIKLISAQELDRLGLYSN